jgi:hypothetical protein
MTPERGVDPLTESRLTVAALHDLTKAESGN